MWDDKYLCQQVATYSYQQRCVIHQSTAYDPTEERSVNEKNVVFHESKEWRLLRIRLQMLGDHLNDFE